MKYLFLEYPKCSTCQKAKKWLDNNNVKYEDRHIVEQNPNIEELKKWHSISQKPFKSLFNTSGLLYKQLNLKDKLPQMSDEELFSLLSSNGMLVKRPLLVGENIVLSGFKEEEWKKILE